MGAGRGVLRSLTFVRDDKMGAGVWGPLGGGELGGMGCDGQEASAFGVRGPSRQLVLPYGRRLRRLRRLQTCATGNGDGRAHSSAPPPNGRRLAGKPYDGRQVGNLSHQGR